MANSFYTIQFSTNPWHLGMSFEAHAYIKENFFDSKVDSKYIFLGGLNQDLIPSDYFPLRFRCFSGNYRSLRFLNNQLEKNEFCDLVKESRVKTRELLLSISDLEFHEILHLVHHREGLDVVKAIKAVELALVDKAKIWKIELVERLPNSIPLLKAYIRTYLTVRDILKHDLTINVNLFNTRFLNERAARDAVLELKGNVLEFEQINSRSDSFGIFKTTVHNPRERAEIARNQFNAFANTEESYVSEWIEKRVNRTLQVFTRKQSPGKLPEIPNEKKVISCFLSSFDELILAGYASNSLGFNQSNSLSMLAEIIQERVDWVLVIRCHPNMLTRPRKEQDYWNQLLSKISALVIGPEESVDTYALIKRSELVLTFGSTVSVEALALGIPSLVIGEALYSGHDLVTTISSPLEVKKFLELKPLVHSDLIQELEIYAFFQLHGGIRFKYLKVKSEEIFNFNPDLYLDEKKIFHSERAITLISKTYSKIQSLKNSVRRSVSKI